MREYPRLALLVAGLLLAAQVATPVAAAAPEPLSTSEDRALFSNTAEATAPDPTAPHLLLTEVVVTPTEGEFIEIYNPGAEVLDLSDVSLTDANHAPNSTFYYNIVTGQNAGGGGFGDFHARFPDGATIDPGEYQTVALAGSDAFSATYGLAPTYELFEDGETADGVPDMREAVAGSIKDQGGFSNSGELAIL